MTNAPQPWRTASPFQSGTLVRRFWLALALAPVSTAIIVVLVADLDTLSSGLLRIDQRAMERIKPSSAPSHSSNPYRQRPATKIYPFGPCRHTGGTHTIPARGGFIHLPATQTYFPPTPR
jgi:hypothetical protein